MSERLPESAQIYLDWNATTPLHPAVVATMLRTAEAAWGNPSSVHGIGRRARAIIEQTREILAAKLELDCRDVVFTSGGTEANNLALRGAPALITSRIEHPSVVRVAESLADAGRLVRWLPVPPSGWIDPESVSEALVGVPNGTVVAVMAANHETGVIQPLDAIADRVHATAARLHVDAVQALGKLDPKLWRGADSIAVAAHKIRGPKGLGALGWRSGAIPEPVLLGGAQERGLRPGTLDPVAASGFGAALELADVTRYAALAPMRDELESALERWAEVNGERSVRLPHMTNLAFRGWRGDELVAALDLAGVCVSSGSACSAGTTEPSPIISAMLGRERAERAVRVSLGDGTSSDELQRAISLFHRVLSTSTSSRSRDG